jgi:hypothetical protein
MPEARLVVAVAGLAILVTVGLYVVLRVRGVAMEEMPDALEHLSEFRRMRDEGAIAEEEYQRLKQTVAEQSKVVDLMGEEDSPEGRA